MRGVIRCTRHLDCAANHNRLCVCLSDNGFGGKDCPFYKTKKQVEAERSKNIAELKRRRQYALIEEYKLEKFLKRGRK